MMSDLPLVHQLIWWIGLTAVTLVGFLCAVVISIAIGDLATHISRRLRYPHIENNTRTSLQLIARYGDRKDDVA